MPLWIIHHPQSVYSDVEKQAFAARITDLYGRALPRFYVGVRFQDYLPGSLFIGGEPVHDFVRIAVDHIARAFADTAGQQWFIDRCTRELAPFLGERALRWELHIDETPFDLWTINGLKPPRANSAAEALWKAQNVPSPYGDEQGR